MSNKNEKSVKSWFYYSVEVDGERSFESLSKIEAEFYARTILQRTHRMPDIFEHTRTEDDSPK